MRFLLLLLVVALIVALLAWLTGQRIDAQVSPIPPGPGEAAWGQPARLLAVIPSERPLAWLARAVDAEPALRAQPSPTLPAPA